MLVDADMLDIVAVMLSSIACFISCVIFLMYVRSFFGCWLIAGRLLLLIAVIRSCLLSFVVDHGFLQLFPVAAGPSAVAAPVLVCARVVVLFFVVHDAEKMICARFFIFSKTPKILKDVAPTTEYFRNDFKNPRAKSPRLFLPLPHKTVQLSQIFCKAVGNTVPAPLSPSPRFSCAAKFSSLEKNRRHSFQIF